MKIQITKEMDIVEMNEITKAQKENRKFIIKDIKIYISNAVYMNLELEKYTNEYVIERDAIIRDNHFLLETLIDDLKDITKRIKEYL